MTCSSSRFGVIAIEKKFITMENLIEAFKIKVTKEIEKSVYVEVGEVLIELGWEDTVFSYRGELEPLILLSSLIMNPQSSPQSPPWTPSRTTIFPPNGQVHVVALPLSCAKWNPRGGGFYYPASPLLGIDVMLEKSRKDRKHLAKTAIGQQFDVEIPIQFEEKILVHEFHFRIFGAEVIGIYY